jgi:hypothetical protein
MAGVDLILIGLLGWQVFMPAVENGKYIFQIDPNGSIVRMNTQNGEMVRCSKELVCEQPKKEK